MPDLRLVAFYALSGIAAGATIYSVVYNTYLDTSNPLLTHLPHPLSATHYYASKSNYLNVYFIKKAWGWTSGIFLFSWFTSPPSIRSGERMWKWITETVIWLLFTSWFFGPALIERVIVASGGECVLTLPSASHPDMFLPTSVSSLPYGWGAVPRLRKGHDISGHLFLLTMSTLFLADQLRYSFRLARRGTLHSAAMIANMALIGIWLFATYTTCLYFHSPLEKISGFLLGVTGFAVTIVFGSASEKSESEEIAGKKD